MGLEKVRTYDKEFKVNAVNLYLTSNRSYKQISKDLGIPTSTLAGWLKEQKKEGTQAFPGKGCSKSSDEELSRLKKELAIVREERDILKKHWASSPHPSNEIQVFARA